MKSQPVAVPNAESLKEIMAPYLHILHHTWVLACKLDKHSPDTAAAAANMECIKLLDMDSTDLFAANNPSYCALESTDFGLEFEPLISHSDYDSELVENTIRPWQLDTQYNLFCDTYEDSPQTVSSITSMVSSPVNAIEDSMGLPAISNPLDSPDHSKTKRRRGRPRKSSLLISSTTMESQAFAPPVVKLPPSQHSLFVGSAPCERPSTQPPHQVPHTMVEKRYRDRLGNSVAELRAAIPTLRAPGIPAAVADEQLSRSPLTRGLKSTHKRNKAMIYAKAVEYIKHLEAKVEEHEEI